MRLRTAFSMLTMPWVRSYERPSSRVSYSRASDERSGRWAGISTPRVGPFIKLRKFLAKTGAATREARGVNLQAKPKGSNSRSAMGEEREPRRSRTAASVALPVGAASAAAALSVMDNGTEAERAEWAAVFAASVAPPEHGPVGDAPVLPVDSLPPASGWK